MKQSQRLMLTWLIDKKGLYAKVKPYLDADDFTEDLYHQAAQLLFEQLEKSELNPARIINHFEDPEIQKEVASLFHAKLNLQSQAEFDKALNETLRKIINNSIEFRTKNMNPADIAGLQKILLDRKKVQDMPKSHIRCEMNPASAGGSSKTAQASDGSIVSCIFSGIGEKI